MYEELIKALQNCAGTNRDCRLCFYKNNPVCYFQMMIDTADALEAAEKRIAELEAQLLQEGEWIELSDRNERKYSHICSNCHRFNIHEGEIEFYHYCPNCGARMKGEQE